MSERGTGNLFRPTYRDRRTGTRRHSAIWWFRIYIHGRRVPMSTETADLKLARQFQRKKAVELAEGRTLALMPAGRRITLADLEKRITDDYVNNGRTSTRHLPQNFRHLGRRLGRLYAHQIDEDVLEGYKAARLLEGAAAATVNLELASLQRSLRLVERRLPRVVRFVYLRVENARKGFFERPAFDAILAGIPERRGAARDLRPPLLVAFLTGWRLNSELLTREKHHADLAAGWLRLEPGETKNGEGRMFPIAGELRTVLEAQIAWTAEWERRTGRICRWLFHRNGKRIASIDRAWLRAKTKAGYPNALVHDLRRTAVRNLERAGVPRSAAMCMVGHKTQAMYSRYAIVDEALLREGAEKLARLHAAQRQESGKVAALQRRRLSQPESLQK